MSAVLTHVHDGGWAELVLNRPERRNAIEGTLAQAMHEALDALERNDDVRAVVLRGANAAFCSGLDLKAFGEQPAPDWVAKFPALWDQVHTQLFGSRKAWIVALERYAINGGAALALAGDLMVCGESAFLQVGEVSLGMAAPRNIKSAYWSDLRTSLFASSPSTFIIGPTTRSPAAESSLGSAHCCVAGSNNPFFAAH